jgi:FkbM family methyltransferase
MRPALFYDPIILLDRLGQFASRKLRLRKLKNTPAKQLRLEHIDSLELLELLSRNSVSTIFDIGSNQGTWTQLAKTIFPNAAIYAFEPLAELRSTYEQNTRTLSNIHYNQIALGPARGTLEMQVNKVRDTSSLLEATDLGKRQWNLEKDLPERVEVWPLDQWLAEKNIPQPDVIKLDIQGYEVEALKGASECLTRGTQVLLEVSFKEFYKGQCLFSDVVSHLASYGYEATAFSCGTPLGARVLQTDVLFGRNKD